ncbi:MAG TPA: c-type cytochrome biogenesis protein CcsB [Syntrophorhabdales bacterium]|nr:c-type cytochrome biogenesis protein CcsB [Syntrophorhabdales bacterium]
MNSQTAFFIPVVLYLIATLFYLVYLTRKKEIIEKIGSYVLVSACLVHLVATLYRYIEAGYTPITNLHESLSFFALCTAVFFLYLRKTYRIPGLGSIVLPVVSIMVIWALTLPSPIKPLPPVLQSYWLPIHTGLAFIGDAIFLVGCLVSIIYILAERDIKKKRLHAIFGSFPSLETLDRVNYRCMSYGFPFLTIGIITGSIWAQSAWGSSWNWDPKETWSLITWIVYAIMIHNRFTMGWRGRKTAYLMILGFISVVVTFLGVNLFIGGLHSYI